MGDETIVNVGIVGGGPGCKAILEMVFTEKLSELHMKVIGVASTNPSAVGFRYAEEQGIYTTDDYRQLYELENLDMIIELTGRDEVAKEISQTKPEHVRMMDHVAARLFWDIFQIEEQRNEEQRRARRELARSEKRYRQLYEASRDGYAMVNMEGRIVECNSSFREMLGYTEEELFEKTYEEITPAKWHGEEARILEEEVFTRGYSTVYEKEYVRKDGTILPIEIRTYLQRDEGGNALGLWAFVRDVTDRKEAEQALRESEAKNRQIIEKIRLGVYKIDFAPTPRLTEVNDVICEDTGYSEEELLSMDPVELLATSEDREKFAQRMADILQEKAIPSGPDYRIRKKDGSIIWTAMHTELLKRNGQPYGASVIAYDVSDRKTAERALFRAKEDWENTFDAITDMVMLLDSEHRIIRVNRATAETLDTTPEALLGSKCYEVVHGQGHPIRGCPLLDTMKTMDPQTAEIVEPRIGGTFICATSPILDHEGKLAGYTHCLKDITEPKHLEAQLRHAQRMEAIGTLAGGIAHDFNNVLMGIQGHTSMVSLNIGSDHAHSEHLKGIETMVQRGAELTRQLLGFARGGKYEVKPTNISELVCRNSEMFGRTTKEITIHGKYDDDIWPVEVDRAQIEQVLLNLYVNAWQAMPGGGELYVETSNTVLDESVTRPFGAGPGKYVRISVTDTGVGMDKATQQQIFDPFFTTKDMGRGTGLGLASAYGIVKNHGGVITVYSEKGEGTTLNVYLPASEAQRVVQEKEPPAEVSKGTETILLVDDEGMILDIARDMLEEMGYSVLIAANGEEALEVYTEQGNEIDLVILDMIMPDMSGGETYDRIKESDAEAKVLLSSGYSIDGQASEILKRGCDGFIQKPFNLQELSGKIREVLEK